jgi:hypothetical protein
MGLDTYAYYKNAEGKSERMPDHLFTGVGSLCGGLFSGGGASFRGKVYAGFLANYIGVNLYQDENHKIAGVADAIQNWLDSNPHLEFSDISRQEIQCLSQWFRVVETHGGFVVGWW